MPVTVFSPLLPTPAVGGNRIALLKNGAAFFPALIAAIDAARADIWIETYIFRDDAAGAAIAAALMAAARRGVVVRVLIDGVGSHDTPKAFFAAMQDALIEVQVFRPERQLFSLKRSRLRRVHRKLALVDGAVGFVGGINLIDDMTESLSEFPRYDYAVRIEGPVLADIYLEMTKLWRIVVRWKRGSGGALLVPPKWLGNSQAAATGSVKIQFAVRDNFRHRRDIEKAYRAAIENAVREVLITSPYFLPGRHFRRSLIEATRRGVKVTLLLQGRADHALLQQATRALYTQLLGAGIVIFEYHRSMLHGKVAVVDDMWATVGSSNLDPCSLVLNREANVVVLDRDFACAVRASVMEEIEANATRQDPADWHKRGMLDRATSWLAYGFARMVAGWLGFAGRLE